MRCSTVCRTLWCTSCSLCWTPLHDWSLAHVAVTTSRRCYDNSTGYTHQRARQVQTTMLGSPVAVRAVTCLPGRWLSPRIGQHRSANVPTCVVPRTYSSYGDKTFASAGPRLWNSLPVQLRNPDISYGRFRRQLKGHLFGNDKHGALWPPICSAIEKRFTYLHTYLLCYRKMSVRLYVRPSVTRRYYVQIWWKSKVQKCYWLWQHLNRLLTCSWRLLEDLI